MNIINYTYLGSFGSFMFKLYLFHSEFSTCISIVAEEDSTERPLSQVLPFPPIRWSSRCCWNETLTLQNRKNDKNFKDTFLFLTLPIQVVQNHSAEIHTWQYDFESLFTHTDI